LGLGLIAVISIMATTMYWCLSSFEVVPVWHRRHFIAVLPPLACLGGGCLGYIQLRLASSSKAIPISVALATSIIVCLGAHQGTFKKLSHYPVALVNRGEDWRKAIEWLEHKSKPESLILLDSGLIESKHWISPKLFDSDNKAKLEYLCFPLRGPYKLKREVMPVARTLQPAIPLPDTDRPTYILTRDAPTITRQRFPNREVLGFGRISLIIPDQPTPVAANESSN
jgi:mannosyltransferase